MLDPYGTYWMYLRKSRADVEAESRGEGETLSKHRKALFQLAKKHNINITKVFEEIESGESILHRPQMVEMLRLMDIEKPDGVLCMDIDRLGRGDKIDQGIIEKTFKENKTLIVTPTEIYDMNEESGEFNVEVRSFLARMELKQTTKRLQGGRRRSVEEGNYIGTVPPYGYLIEKTSKERYLIPHPEQAKYVKMIFELYTHPDPKKRMGSSKIANELTRIGAPSYTEKGWDPSSVLNILKNAVYAGRIQWGKKITRKSTTPGQKKTVQSRPKSEWIDVKGKHEPLVSMELYQKAQEILGNRYHIPYHLENGVVNPLAGLVECEKCGRTMVLRPYTDQPAHLMCINRRNCNNKSSRFAYIENALITALQDYLHAYKTDWNRRKKHNVINYTLEAKKSSLKTLIRELEEHERQKGNLHDLLERQIYTVEQYLERSNILTERIEDTKNKIENLKKEISQEEINEKMKKDFIPKIEQVIKFYHKTKDPKKKNDLLKSVLEKTTYRKELHQRNDDFTLVLYPKLHR